MRISERFQVIADILRHPGSQGRRPAALLDYFRWNLGHRMMGVDYVLPLADEARLIVSDRQNYATLVYMCRLWDFPEQAFLLHLLRPGDIFVDAGANVGGYTVLASAVAGATSHAFEPVPRTYAELRRNLRLNDIESLVQAHCCALGETAGVSVMTAGQGGMNHIVASPAGADTVEVRTDRLDHVLAGAAARLIKMDAEGFELSILRGAPDTLANPGLQAVIVELNGSGGRYGVSDDDVHREISRFGFQPCGYDARTRALTPLGDYNRSGMNTLYVRDRAAVAERVAAARPFRLRDRNF
ncbi:MAG: hypothetical protein BGP12_04365 [Rhodospirillales bacterium 70-18]|nr:FkbM family methyltransferase [Rhodospirillales bacterium]OJY64967.1 MAG: hypothetical protein BGP12_04365 [Rhodospirillales bacterium 70-18]